MRGNTVHVFQIKISIEYEMISLNKKNLSFELNNSTKCHFLLIKHFTSKEANIEISAKSGDFRLNLTGFSGHGR